MNSNRYSLYIKNLYVNAGRTVMDRIFSVLSPTVNYDILDAVYKALNFNAADIKYCVCDCYGVFFHKLCCALSQNVYSECTVYYILSPYHHTDIVCQMLIPEKNAFFSNDYLQDDCKVNNLYRVKYIDKYHTYLHFAEELFEKSEKIQQEYPQ